jgi:1-acyl-sn-glycerol-3-phosphate acyltransferase
MIVSRKLVSSEAGGHWRIRRFFYVTLPGSIETGGAVEKAIEALKKGEAVVLYPEGRVVRKGEKVKPKPGMALFALGAKVPIIPIKIIGTDKIWPERQKNPNFADYFKFKRVEVVIGKPIELTKFYHKKVSEKEIQKIANKIMEKLYKL